MFEIMPNYFEIFAQNFSDLGGFSYAMPFLLITTILFAMFRKSKILGDSWIINGIISLSISFMVIFGFPISTGFSIATPLSMFFMQISVFILVFMVGTMMASIFYPNMQEWLPTVFKSRNWLMIGLAIGVAFFVTSGLVGVFTTGFNTLGVDQQGNPAAPRDVTLIAAGIVIFIVIILIASSVGSGRVKGAGGGHE
ncbi:hypothetical protein EPN87_00430 [archaeon]|nr:MAG: hypothetical protein EPN87_00430 [archaeon]